MNAESYQSYLSKILGDNDWLSVLKKTDFYVRLSSKIGQLLNEEPSSRYWNEKFVVAEARRFRNLDIRLASPYCLELTLLEIYLFGLSMRCQKQSLIGLKI